MIPKVTASSRTFTNNQTHIWDVACITCWSRASLSEPQGRCGIFLKGWIKFTTPTIYKVPRPHSKLLTDAEQFAAVMGKIVKSSDLWWIERLKCQRHQMKNRWEKQRTDTNMHGESWSFYSPIFHLTWDNSFTSSLSTTPLFCLCSHGIHVCICSYQMCLHINKRD